MRCSVLGVQLVIIAMDSNCVLIANQNETITTMTVKIEEMPKRSTMIPRGTPVWSKEQDGTDLFVCPKWDARVCLNGVLANDVRFNKGDTELKEIAVVTGGVVSVRMDKSIDTITWNPYLIICDKKLGECRLVLNHAVRTLDVGKGGETGESGGRGELKPENINLLRVLTAISSKGTIKGENLANLTPGQISVAKRQLDTQFKDEDNDLKDKLNVYWKNALGVIADAKKLRTYSYDEADINLGELISASSDASFAAKMPGVSRSMVKKRAETKKALKAAMRK